MKLDEDTLHIFTADLRQSFCLAPGVPFFGRAVERRAGTVILAAEGAGTIKNRLRVARKQWVGDEPLPISFRTQVVSLTNPAGLAGTAAFGGGPQPCAAAPPNRSVVMSAAEN
jgi:hypothetical protein